MTVQTVFTRKASEQARAELLAAGWQHVCTTSCGDDGVRYGSLFVKAGARYYLNRDTYIPGLTGDAMADACRPIFNPAAV